MRIVFSILALFFLGCKAAPLKGSFTVWDGNKRIDVTDECELLWEKQKDIKEEFNEILTLNERLAEIIRSPPKKAEEKIAKIKSETEERRVKIRFLLEGLKSDSNYLVHWTWTIEKEKVLKHWVGDLDAVEVLRVEMIIDNQILGEFGELSHSLSFGVAHKADLYSACFGDLYHTFYVRISYVELRTKEEKFLEWPAEIQHGEEKANVYD